MAVFLIQVNINDIKNINNFQEKLISFSGKIIAIWDLLYGVFKGAGIGTRLTKIRKNTGGQHRYIFFSMNSRAYPG